MSSNLVPSHAGYWWRSGVPVRVIEYLSALKKKDGSFSKIALLGSEDPVEDDGTWEGPCLTRLQLEERLANEAAQERLRLADLFQTAAAAYVACAIKHANRGTPGMDAYNNYQARGEAWDRVAQHIRDNEAPPPPRDPWTWEEFNQ